MNVLIVGLGSIAKKHIAALREIDAGINFYALRSSLHAQSYEGVKNVFSLAELEAVPVDFAIVSTPTAEHKATIEQLLPLKCPLFIEKPLYHTLEVEELLFRVKNAHILTYVACNLRFLGCLQFLKENIQGKIINEVNSYCGSYLPEWRPGIDWKTTYSAQKDKGGGVHIDLIHEIDYLYWLFGNPKRSHKIFRTVSSLEMDVYDYANYVFEYDEFTASVILNYYRRDYRRTLELVFEDETWEVDLVKNQICCSNQILFKSDQSIKDTYQSQMNYFLDSIKSGNCFNDIEESYTVLKLCLE